MVRRFVSGVPSGRTHNYPESGRGLGHVTLKIFGNSVGNPSDSLASRDNSQPELNSLYRVYNKANYSELCALYAPVYHVVIMYNYVPCCSVAF